MFSEEEQRLPFLFDENFFRQVSDPETERFDLSERFISVPCRGCEPHTRHRVLFRRAYPFLWISLTSRSWRSTDVFLDETSCPKIRAGGENFSVADLPFVLALYSSPLLTEFCVPPPPVTPLPCSLASPPCCTLSKCVALTGCRVYH